MTKRQYLYVGMSVVCSFPAWSGNLDSPAAPDSASGAMYTLESIYQRLDSGATGSKRGTGFSNPVAGPGSTGHTLDEIMSKAPALDNINGATAADVPSGLTFWGLKPGGGWGAQTGTAVGGVGGGGYPAPVEKTGQTISYEANDDGDLEKGVALPIPRFTDHGDGTLTDNLTGLMWLRDIRCPSVKRTWEDAFDDVLELNGLGKMNSNFCAGASSAAIPHTGWRLPNVKEIYSLIDFGNDKPMLPTGHPFINLPDLINGATGDIWASNTAKENTTISYVVDIKYGGIINDNKTNTHWVLPVRDAQ